MQFNFIQIFKSFSYEFCRNTSKNDIWRHVFGNHGSSCNYTPSSKFYTLEYCYICSNPNVIFYFNIFIIFRSFVFICKI